MPRPLSPAAKAAIFAQETDKAFIVLLTISHPTWEEDMLFSNDATEPLTIPNTRGTKSRGDEYIFLPFSVKLPQQDETGNASASLSIDNISREIVYRIRQAQAVAAARVKIEIIVNTTPDVVEMTLPNFRLSNVSYDALTITGDIDLKYFDLEPFPARTFTPSDFPAMF